MANIAVQEQTNNVQHILSTIIDKGPVTKKEIQAITGLSWGLISEKTNKLLEEKYIVSSVRKTVGVGRKTEEFDVNSNRNCIIGLEISYRRINIVVTDMKGRVLEQEVAEFEPEHREYDYVKNEMLLLIDKYYNKYQHINILGIGVAIQGVVDFMQGVSVRINRIKDWKDVPIKKMIEDKYGINVIVEHDPDCLMKSECGIGALRNSTYQEILMVSISHAIGVATAISINGSVYKGHKGMAGEIGKSVIGDGKSGYELLENHITREGIISDYEEMFHEKKRFSQIENGALEKDEKCVALLTKLAEYVGVTIAEAGNLLNPDIIIVNTRECKCQELIFEEIKKAVKNICWDEEVKVILSKLDDNAIAVGAALTVIESELSKIGKW